MDKSERIVDGYVLETYFKRIVDKKKVCEIKRLKDGEWAAKDTFRCRNAWYEDKGNRFVIVRLDITRRVILTEWEAWFNGKESSLYVRKGTWLLVCRMDPSDVKWIQMRIH